VLNLLKSPYALLALAGILITSHALVYHQGVQAARAAQERIDDKAQKRINAVPPADSATIIKRMQSGTF
jgi:hypothetical protein